MNIFTKLFKKPQSNKTYQEISTSFKHVEEEYTSLDLPSTLSNLSVDGFLDTTKRENIELFKNNLKILIQEVKRKGKIDKFVLLRNDNYLPDDWIWRVASKNTGMELNWNYLSQAIKEGIIKRSLPNYNANSLFESFIPPQKMQESLSKLEKKLAFILLPVRFRSTKHFTINVPLSHTHTYNMVEANRNFTVIDSIDNFLNSGYAYSAAYFDAYLDVTHEGLAISDNATILISEEKYKTIITDQKLIEQLKNRKVIIFRGDEGLATNMVLSEMGVLPAQVGTMYADYDDELIDIKDNSIKQLCLENQIEYNLSHGGIKEGHFTSRFDDLSKEHEEALCNFANFLIEKFPEHTQNIQMFTKERANNSTGAYEMVKLLGPEILLQAIEEFNTHAMLAYQSRKIKYKYERDNLSQEIKTIFKKTVSMIKQYYYDCEFSNLSFETQNELEKLFIIFFHSDKVNVQYEAAIKIIDKLSKNKENNIVDSNLNPTL